MTADMNDSGPSSLSGQFHCFISEVVTTGPLACGHLISPPGFYWPPKFKVWNSKWLSGGFTLAVLHCFLSSNQYLCYFEDQL